MNKYLFILVSILLFQGSLKAEAIKILPIPIETENYERLRFSYKDLISINENDDLLIKDNENQRFIVWNIKNPDEFSHIIYDNSNTLSFSKMDQSNGLIGLLDDCPLTWTRQNGLQILAINDYIRELPNDMSVRLEDINSKGQILGTFYTDPSLCAPNREAGTFLCEEGKCINLKLDERLKAIGYKAGSVSVMAINDVGVILFYAHVTHPSDSMRSSIMYFLYEEETITPLPTLDDIFKKNALIPLALNNKNEVLLKFNVYRVHDIDNKIGTYVWQKEKDLRFVSNADPIAFNDKNQILTRVFLRDLGKENVINLIDLERDKVINLTDILNKNRLKINYLFTFNRESFLMNNNLLVFIADRVDYPSEDSDSTNFDDLGLDYFFDYDVEPVLVIIDLAEIFDL